MKAAIKRIVNIDLKNINNSKLDEQGIFIKFDEENMMKATAMIIGPKDSLYEHGILLFDITFPVNYPFSPPTLTYKAINNIRIHPNMYVNGKVCLSILGTWAGPGWTSAMDIVTVMITIQSLLDKNPIMHEPGYENVLDSPKGRKININYNTILEYNTYNSLLYKNLIYKDDMLFKEEINNYFNLNKDNILEYLKNKSEMQKDIKECKAIYGIRENIDYISLYQNFLKLKV